jgi:hypothetical protein
VKVFLSALALTLLASSAEWSQAQIRAVPVLQMAIGELARVDPISQSFSIKAADGSERTFKYNKNTQVVGATNSREGLASTNRSRVSVLHFQALRGDNIAVRIEVLRRL